MAETTLAMSFTPLEELYTLDHISRDALERDRAEPVEPGPASRGFIANGPAPARP